MFFSNFVNWFWFIIKFYVGCLGDIGWLIGFFEFFGGCLFDLINGFFLVFCVCFGNSFCFMESG